MRRWNGWGDERIEYPLPPEALPWLAGRIGESTPPRDATLEQILKTVPESPLPPHPLISTDAEDRLRHARGQSLPDWVALRSGRVGVFPAGVAYPESEDDLPELFRYARQSGASLIPYGGGTSVVGHITPLPNAPPALTVDLSHLDQFIELDEASQLATFGAGVRGPHLEAALRARGYTLGHYPQSFEYSTLGGWIATRSSGQQSLYYGRIEDHFAGGRVISPAGVIELQPHPASAAGPDLRQLVLGSEGRMGIISRAVIRVSPLPEEESFHAVFFPEWEAGVEAVREMVQARLPLSMLRLSNSVETETNLALAGRQRLIEMIHRGLRWLGYPHPGKCLLIFGVTGSRRTTRRARRDALALAREHGGLYTGQYIGRHWQESRFLTPYLRNSLWKAGYAVDTLETAIPWSGVLPLAGEIIGALNAAAESAGERVHAFAHLSHLYRTGASIYVTFIFRLSGDPDRTLERWARMKRAASETIIRHGGTISHQHGIGTDHVPYLGAEKGRLGITLLRDVMRSCDPDGILNPGKLLPADGTLASPVVR